MKFVKQLAYIICCSQLSYAATYHVAQQHPNAVDQDESGSSDKPYKTIGAAVKKLSAGDTLVIHAGIYRESVVVKALGTKEEPIKIHAARYAYVEMNGASR